MTNRAVARVQLGFAVVALVGAVVCWLSASSVVSVPPVVEGEPTMVSTVYDTSLIALSFLLAGVAAIAMVTGVARLRS